MTGEHTSELQYPAGIKWTRQRKEVYSILSGAEEPMSAIRIYRSLGEDVKETCAVSTVYRVLAAFEEKGIVEKNVSLEDGVALYELHHDHHTHYAVCLDCHRRVALEHCPIARVSVENETGEFVVTGHKLELYGYCKDCRKKYFKNI